MTNVVRRLLPRLIPSLLRGVLRDLRQLTAHQRGIYLRRRLRLSVRSRLPADVGLGSRLVFICYGNVLRSPMAAALFRATLEAGGADSANVSSAGVAATALPRPAHQDGRRVASKFGVSLESHRSTVLTADLVAGADLLVVMDHLHEAMLIDRFPEAEGRTVLLGAFDPSARNGRMTIEDPYGLGERAVEASYARIARSVTGLASRLASGREEG